MKVLVTGANGFIGSNLVDVISTITGRQNLLTINIPSFMVYILGRAGDIYSLLTGKRTLPTDRR